MTKSIYLAGKIGPGNWRHQVVEGLRDAYLDQDLGSEQPWPVLERAVLGVFDYVGPYFVSCDHGCAHGPATHGSAVGGCIVSAVSNGAFSHAGPSGVRRFVAQQCRRALELADVVFVWLDDLTAYGTLVEIGITSALGKDLWVASPGLLNDELWFAGLSSMWSMPEEQSPEGALQYLIRRYRVCESPAEQAFWDAWLELDNPLLDGLAPQHEVLGGKYRLDFALPDERIAVEIDGFAYHGGQDAFMRDRARQRELEGHGWRFIRFAAKEVLDDPRLQVHEAQDIIYRWRRNEELGK